MEWVQLAQGRVQ